MENKTTVKDVLIDVSNLLNNIKVPMSMINEIGLPIAQALQGINACLGAFEVQEAQQAAEEDKPVEPEVTEEETNE